MSVTTETNRLAFVGDGTDNSPYAISFPLRDTGSVGVRYVTDSTGAEVLKVIVTDYTIAIAADNQTATLTLVTAAPATGVTLLITREDPATRLSSYSNFDGQPSRTLNSDFDLGALVDQTLQEQLDRTIRVSKGQPLADLPLTPLILKGAAGKHVIVNSGETDFELSTQLGLPQTHGDNLLIRTDGTDTGLMQVTGISIDDSDNVAGVGTLASGALTVTGAATISTTLGVTGNVTVSGVTSTITVASDTDTTHTFGRARLGGVANQAYFCHIDNDNVTDRALIQAEDGTVQIRTKTARIIDMYHGSVNTVAVSNSLFALLNGMDFKTPGGTQVFVNNADIFGATSALVVHGSMQILEQAAADAQTAAYGQYWVKTAVPSEPWFDGDTGVERQLMQGDGTTVADESVFTADGTTGGLLKETAMIVTSAGAVSGVTTLATSGLATLNTLTVNGVSQLTGKVRMGTVGTAAEALHVIGAAGVIVEVESEGSNNVRFRATNTSGSWDMISTSGNWALAEVGGATEITVTSALVTINSNDLALSSGNLVVGASSIVANADAGDIQTETGALIVKERTTPTADTNYGKYYTKTDNKAYFQDGAGAEHEIAFV